MTGACKSDWETDSNTATWVNFTTLGESANSFKDPKGCNYHYVSTVKTITWTAITWEPAMIDEQLYEVYTWKENGASGSYISAWRILDDHLVPPTNEW
jgi:hypothetical protein